MSRSPRITAAIIALNEERHTPYLLASLTWVDEIVFVDGGSFDRTAEFAAAHGARVFQHAFDTYAQQRNRALDLATGDWVLSIDADERVTPSLAKEIRRCVCDTRRAAYRTPIRSRIFGRRFRFSGTQDDRPIRLFRRDAARWQGDVHETLCVQGEVGWLCDWLEHDTLPDLTAFLGKMERYTTLAAQRRVAEGRRPRWSDRWLAPAREVMRRLIWKQGWLDGPEGWAFSR